eukprot:XP_011675977.1 PREDICTED: uncharacterized protein LOC105443966 [Strongylocentrotus purpuratus]
MEQTTELLVQWKKDGSKNVVVYGDIQCPCIPIKGTKVFMPWKGRRWEGVVLAVDDESEESDDDSIPLAQLIIKDHVPLPDQPRLDIGDVGVTMTDVPHEVQMCEHFTCLHEVFSTCSQCLVFLCEHHFKEDDPCANHNN